ncbi:hypothetical protein EZV62_006126 [Acer yangbiense]|uniref:MIF4G domain-containing protein n=1 Tax=Acer yangbiense TaxID=1000413 RepID=A0A5C7IPI5_9ROSI|nr:hypothetical protein EZV62_006126 [Acer yangbiense]
MDHHNDQYRAGGEHHNKPSDEEAVAHLEEIKKSIEAKMALHSGFLRSLDSSIKRNTAIIKKLKQLNEEQREGLMDELRSANLSKFVSEAVTAICDAKLRSSDIQALLQSENTSLRQMEHENAKILNAKGELSEENASSYEKLRKSYDLLYRNVSSLAEALDMQPPVIPEDIHTTRVTSGEDASSPAAGKDSSVLEAVWGDEDTRSFYECLPGLRKAFLCKESASEPEQGQSATQDAVEVAADSSLEGTNLDALLQRLPGCVGRDLIDQLTDLFGTAAVLLTHGCNTVNLYEGCLFYALADAGGRDQMNIETKIRNIRFIGELCKFKIASAGLVFTCLKQDVLDPQEDCFRMRMVITLLETCGHYFDQGSSKRKLDRFLIHFQRFILSKGVLPLDVEFDLQDLFADLRHNMTQYSSIEEVNAALIDFEEHERNVSTEKAHSDKYSDAEKLSGWTTTNSISSNGKSGVRGTEENGGVHEDSDSDSGSDTIDPEGHDEEGLDEENHDEGDNEDDDDDERGGPASDEDDDVCFRQKLAEVDPEELANFDLELRAVVQESMEQRKQELRGRPA